MTQFKLELGCIKLTTKNIGPKSYGFKYRSCQAGSNFEENPEMLLKRLQTIFTFGHQSLVAHLAQVESLAFVRNITLL